MALPTLSRPGTAVAVAVLLAASLAAVGTPDVNAAPSTHVGEAPVQSAPAGRLPPRPAQVDAYDDPPDGELAFVHGLAWMTLPPGTDAQPELAVVSGADRRLELAVEALPVQADEFGAPAPHDPADEQARAAPLPGADGWLTLAEAAVVLDPGERATLRPTVTVPDDAPTGAHLAALRVRAATDVGGPVEVSAVLVVEVGAPGRETTPAPALSVELSQRDGRTLIELRMVGGDGVSAVSGDLTVRGWWGSEAAVVDLPPTVVLPRTERVREVRVHPPPLPGRYAVTAVLTTREGQHIEASAAGWLWQRGVAAVTAGVLLVLAVLALLRVRRRTADRDANGGEPTAATDEPTTDPDGGSTVAP